MGSTIKTVLLVGDQNDAFVQGIDYLYKQAETQPWLASFLADNVAILKEQMTHWESTLRDTMGVFHTFQELADKYRTKPDPVGMSHGMLVFIMRQALLLQAVKRDATLINDAETVPICGGLLNTAALEIATDFDSLYGASLEMTRVLCRMEVFSYYRSRATEISTANWGWTLVGISADKLKTSLDAFQRSMGIPEVKKVKVAVIGQGWSTIIGPPSVLDKVLKQCPAIKNLTKQEMAIHALHHSLNLTDAELDSVVGDSALLDLPLGDGTWRSTVRAACEAILCKPFNIVDEVKTRVAKVKATTVELIVIGPSPHDNFVRDQLKGAGKDVTVTYEHKVPLTIPTSPSSVSDKIAIVGMAGRAPSSDDMSEFWRIVITGQDVHKEIPGDRWDINEFFSASHKGRCTSNSRYGCFIDKPGAFDARFFNISQREALLMEPCHRLWLMATYEALEMSGYSAGRTRVTDPNRIGAFFGQSVDDWRANSHQLGCDAYNMQGMQKAFGPGRVNFHFKWEGPTYQIDSACASSASAITMACAQLIAGEIDMAVAGGSTIMSSPHTFSALSRAGVLSTTGNCKTYRDDADGYCRGDFSGCVVLKRVEDAIAANDNILAVISASGRNHAGNAKSITTSDAGSQERLFRQVLRKAQITPEEINYVEMHGTGTQVGDLAEMTAVSNTFTRAKGDKVPLRVGAVKANIGHTEAAAGIASLIKCVMMLQEEFMPPVANMPHKLNPKFPDLKALMIDIPSQRVEFKYSSDKRRRIVLNNFDASGGNSCLLIEDAVKPADKAADTRSSHTITLSAKTALSHAENKKRLLNFLRASMDDHRIEDLAYTLTARRIHYPIRTAFAASSIKEVVAKLDADIKADKKEEKTSPAPVIFMFTGQGSHYAGMGAELYETSPAFRNILDLSVSICKQNNFPEFLDIITNREVDMSTKDTAQTQLAVVALEIALAAFWRAAGIEPAAVMGHSLGEYAALHVAGVLSLTDVLFLVGRRAQLVLERCVPGDCSMLSVYAPVEKVEQYLSTLSSCEIACINSPKATVVSGTADEIATLKQALEAAEGGAIRSTQLTVPYGFHSVQVDPVLDDFAAIARGVIYSAPKVPIVSTLAAEVVDKPGMIAEVYLMQQTREKVNFAGALKAAADRFKNPVFLEVGPSRVLGSFAQATLDVPTERIASTLENAKETAWSGVSKSLATLYKAGIEIDWIAVHEPSVSRSQLKHISTLPAYNWDVKDYWIKWTEPREAPVAAPAVAAAPVAAAPAAVMERPISAVLHYVVKKTLNPKVEVTFKSSAADPALKAAILGHRLRDVPVCPGGVFCEMGLEAAQHTLAALGKKNVDLVLLTPAFNRPFSMPSGESKAEILTTITMPTEKTLTATFKVSSGPASYDLGSCRFAVVDNKKLQADWDKTAYFVHARMADVIKAAKEGDGHRFKPSIFYSLFSNTVKYAGSYMGLQEAYISSDFKEAVAEVVLQQDPSDPSTKSSPYWSDSLVHLAGFVANVNPSRPEGKMFMMGGFDKSEQTAELAAGRKYHSYVRVTKNEGDAFVCDVFVFDVLSGNRLVMQCSNLKFHEVEYATLERAIGKVTAAAAAPAAKAAAAKAVTPKAAAPKAAALAPAKKEKVVTPKALAGKEVSVLDTLLAAIASETGTPIEDLTDDAVLGEIGIDSIMAIQISASVKGATGYDISATWGLEFPTIGALREEFKGIMSAPGADDGEEGSDEEEEEDVEEEEYEMIADEDVDDPDEQDIESLDSAAPAVMNSVSGKNVLDTFLGAIANETGTPLDELTDEVVLTELGVDSIMAIQICGTVKQETGVELPPTFVFEYPTVGDLRAEFGGMEANSSVGSSSGDEVGDDTDVTDADEPAPAPVPAPKPKKVVPAPTPAPEPVVEKKVTPIPAPAPVKKAAAPKKAKAAVNPLEAMMKNLPAEIKAQLPAGADPASLVKDMSVFKFEEENEDTIDFSTVPKAKIVLMQGKPTSKETPLFLIPDGSGTAATYIHLPPFPSGLPIYAIESPFLRCPGKLSRKTGIPGLAGLVVDAILKHRPEGPYLIGGYSGGATISYEVARQLAAKGKRLQGLLLIDMCSPRSMIDTIDSVPEQGLAVLMRLSPPDKRSFWTSSMASQFAQQHQRQIVRAVCHYDPPPMAESDRPERVVIVWGRRGLVERAKSDTKVLGMMAMLNVRTESGENFMMDPSLGPVAWAVPSKKEGDLGPNGWDRFVGEKMKILVAEADHLSMPVPPDVAELHRCINEALPYLNGAEE
ncbi:unnamed protein product [Discula destructiva]